MLLIPFFTKVLEMNSKKARATAITVILFLVLSGSFFYFKSGDINWQIAIYAAIGGLIGSYLGSKLLVRVSSRFLNIIFIIFLIYSGIRMI